MLKQSNINDDILPQNNQVDDSAINNKQPTPVNNSKAPKNKKKESKLHFTSILKIFNIILGISITVLGILCYIFFQSALQSLNFIRFILPAYISLPRLIIIAIQLRIKIIRRNMKFLYTYIGRGLFNIYAGIMPLALLPKKEGQIVLQVIIYIFVSLMCIVGLLYILARIFCCAEEKKTKKKSKDENSSDQGQERQL